ncbi:Macrolide export protein MacA [bacterium HR17]|uniref:Macrolide export protein MacA n=1 Tax=Candidatus Fervidibacter japonicus TaxID=2035412 RepID=A0A2H5XBC8_9BACT|nr:Macrolide export protein MacA [bacterium HR17]
MIARRWLFLTAPLLLSVAWWLWRQRPVAVQVIPVRQGRLVEVVYATGTVKPAQELLVDAKVSAQVKAILVKEGQRVRQGQALALLDAADFEMKVREAEKRLRVAEAQWQQLRAGTDPLDIAALRAELDAAIAQWRAAQTEIATAQAQWDAAKARYRQALDSLRLTRDEVQTAIRQAEENLRIAESQLRQAQIALETTKEVVRQQIAQAEAALKTAKAQAALLDEGAREEEKRRAKAALDAAKAALDEAQRQRERAHRLFAEGAIAKADVDAAETRYALALAEWQAAEANWQQVIKGARPQEREAAHAQVAQAEAALEAAKARQAEIRLRQQDVETAQARLAQAQAQLRAAKANERQIALRQAEVDAASAQLRQAEALLRKAAAAERTAKARMDAVQAKLAQARRGARPEMLEVARREYEAALQAYEDAQRKLSDFVVRAPVDGVITEVVAKVGSYLAAGFGMSTIVKMATGEQVSIEAQVDEADIGKVRLGQRAYFRVDAYPERVYRAIVARIHPEADKVTRTYRVELRDIEPPHGLKLGMSGDVNIQVTVVPDAVLVPTTAVASDTAAPSVWVVENGRARLRRVRIGARDNQHIHVRSGVRVGEFVIINPPSDLQDGQPVRFQLNHIARP